MRPTDTPLPQRYRTIRRLGRGGMATVFLAEDERLGRRVAVKRLHADSPADVARRFEREAKVGASLNHPNVVTVYDTTIDDDGALIASEPAPESENGGGVPFSENPDPTRGQSLNDEGFALLEAGRPEEALPQLEAAVASYPQDSEDVQYSYALFNYGRALRMTGDPEAAIPVLERRLEFPSQQDVVRRELELAREAAGE